MVLKSSELVGQLIIFGTGDQAIITDYSPNDPYQYAVFWIHSCTDFPYYTGSKLGTISRITEELAFELYSRNLDLDLTE